MIEGNYWITNEGLVTPLEFPKHDTVVIDKVRLNICDKIGVEFDQKTWKEQKEKITIDHLNKMDPESRIEAIDEFEFPKIYQEVAKYYGIDQHTIDAADDQYPLQKYIIENWGWKNIKQNIINTDKLLKSDFEAIYSGVNDILKKEGIDTHVDDSTIRFMVYDHSNQEEYDYSLLQILQGTKEEMPDYGDIITPKGLNFNYSFKEWFYLEWPGEYGNTGMMADTKPGIEAFQAAGAKSKYKAYMKKRMKKKQKKQ